MGDRQTAEAAVRPLKASHGARAHRDRDREVDFGRPGFSSTPWINRQTAQPAPPIASESAQVYTDELARGNRWMRFSRDIEEQYQIDTRAAHWKRVILCIVVGQISIWASGSQAPRNLPDVASMLMVMWGLVSLVTVTGIAACVWVLPRPSARAWHIDFFLLPATLGTVYVTVWPASSSATYVASLHTANEILMVMWACVLARQGFWFALGVSLAALLCAWLLPHAPSPEQQQIVWSNFKVLLVATPFSLAANYLLEHRARRAYLMRKIEEVQRGALTRAAERLRDMSLRDPLTGIANRRRLDAELEDAWSAAAQGREPLALVMLDVDHFKAYNDRYGHPMGDGCLNQVAHALDEVAADTGGLAARVGGEEFALLLPRHGLDEALAAARTACERVRALAIAHDKSTTAPHLTISAGVSAVQPDAKELEASSAQRRLHLRERADVALYKAKQQGRNQAAGEWLGETAAAGAVKPREPALKVVMADESDLAAVKTFNTVLQQGFRWLRFPEKLEAAYMRRGERKRQRQLIQASVGGIVLYNGYALTSYGLVPDVAHRLLSAQIATNVCMAIVLALLFLPMGRRLREWAYTATLCAATLAALWTYAPSQSPTVYAAYMTLMLIPLFGAIGARLPFWQTCAPIAVAFAGLAFTMKHPVNPQETAMVLEAVTMLFTGMAFIALASYTLELGDRTHHVLTRLERAQRRALAHTGAKLEKLAMLDPLTGIRNRRQFEAEMQRIAAEAGDQHVSMLIADVDDFKPFNDHYGHVAGDECLKRLAAAMDEIAKAEGAVAARLGGEEFGLLMPRKGLREAVAVGQRLCAAIRELHIEHRFARAAQHVTLSVGVAQVSSANGSPGSDLLARADAALYEAKASGRNKVCSELDVHKEHSAA